MERGGALVGLAHRLDDQVRKYAEAFYERPETRGAALEAMRRSLDRSFAPYFPKHLEDDNLEVRARPSGESGYLGIADSAEKLKAVLRRRGSARRRAVLLRPVYPLGDDSRAHERAAAKDRRSGLRTD